MPKMVSMKRQGDDDAYCVGWSPPNFPGGLCLFLDEDQCEALGIGKALRPGTEVTITAKAIVESSTESLERDGDDRGNDVRLQLQITELGLTPGAVVRNAADVLYGDASTLYPNSNLK